MARLAAVPDPCFVWMAGQTVGRDPRRNLAQGGQGLLCRPAQYHKVVGVPHHPAAALFHQEIERMQVEVGQERRDDRPLGRPRRRPRHVLHDILLEEAFEQRQDRPVADRMRNQGHQPIVRDGIEIAFQVGVHHEGEPFLQQVPGQPPARAGVPGIDVPPPVPHFRDFREGRLLHPRPGRKP